MAVLTVQQCMRCETTVNLKKIHCTIHYLCIECIAFLKYYCPFAFEEDNLKECLICCAPEPEENECKNCYAYVEYQGQWHNCPGEK